jgi:hypothetical protein
VYKPAASPGLPGVGVKGTLSLDVSASSLAALKLDEKAAGEALIEGVTAALGTPVGLESLDTTSATPVLKFVAYDETYFEEIAALAAGLEPEELVEGGLLGSLNAAIADSFPTVSILSVSVSPPTMLNGCVSAPVANGVNCSGGASTRDHLHAKLRRGVPPVP